MTSEGELPLELFGVKSYRSIQFKSLPEIKDYLRLVYKNSKLETWAIDLNEVVNSFSQKEFPIIGPEVVKSLFLNYKNIHKPNAKIVLYKAAPLMPWHIKDTMVHFNDSKHVHLIRDPRAVFNSQKSSINPYDNRPFTFSPIATAMDWRKAVNESNSFINSNIHCVRYEDIVQNTAKALSDIIGYFDVSHTSSGSVLQQFLNRIPEAEKDLHKMIGHSPNIRRINAWETILSSRDKMYIDVYLGDLLKKTGYEQFYHLKDFTFGRRCLYIIERGKVLTSHKMNRIIRVIKGFIKSPKYYFNKLLLKITKK